MGVSTIVGSIWPSFAWLAGVSLLACSGCGRPNSQLPEGAQVSAPMHHLPARAEVERLMNSAPPMPSSEPTVMVTDWFLEASDAQNPTHEKYLQQRLEKHEHLSASASLSCAALEWARVYQKHRKLPDDRARRYFLSRCGGVATDAASFVIIGQADPASADANVLAQLTPQIDKALEQYENKRMDVGFAMLREKASVAVALTLAQRRITLAPLTRVLGAEPHVTVRGRLEEDAPAVMALVNQGAYGVAHCEPDRALSLPEFRFKCPVSPDDAQVSIDLLAQPENELLLNVLGTLMLYRDEEASRHYQPLASAEVTDASPTDALLAALNEVRQQANMKQLTLSARQSEQNTKIAPHFFTGLATNDRERGNQAALAMLAGFGVDGIIQDATVLGLHASANASPENWVHSTIERPFGRYILLNPNMDAVGIGIVPQTSGLAAVVSTYRFFGNNNSETAAKTVLRVFNEQRRALGAPPATLWQGNQHAQAQAAKVAARQTDEHSALESTLNAMVQATGRSAAAFAVPTIDLESIQFPPELLSGGPPLVSIGVHQRQLPGSPWGEYLVLFVIAPGSAAPPTEMAQR